MSVTELAPREDFERTPPHDIAAEQCVLGGMLMSKDAISDVLEVIRPGDHYRPAHQIVHETVLDLYARGEPADPVTIAAELTKRGDIGKIGGAPYLHTLIASVPTAANAGYYARIVRELAIKRRLVEVGTRIVQLGYSGDGDADELVDRAQAEVYGVTERRVSDDYLPLSEIMPGTLVEIEAIGSRGGTLTGVPTGFADLDALTNGLHQGQMIVIAARPALGKALALDTPLPTPHGWTTMGDVSVGDRLLGADGRPVTVVAATGVMRGRSCYAVEFSGGEVIVADAQHQWLTCTRAARWYDAQLRDQGSGYAHPVPPQVVTTEQIAETLRCGAVDARPHHAVALCEPLLLPDADLPIPPYALGCWLGAASTSFWPGAASTNGPLGALQSPQRAIGTDGHSGDARIRTPEPELVMHLEGSLGCVRSPGSFEAELADLDVMREKHVPLVYLRASEQQRRDLLAGILDADGTVSNSGSIRLAVASRDLAEGVRELVHSLGYCCSMTTRRVMGKTARASTRYLLDFTTADEVFRLSSKQAMHKERLRRDPRRARWRRITAVRPIRSVPVRCVQVSSSDGLYLAGKTMVPTHNSTMALDLARAASIKHGLASVIFSLEMSRNEITMRLLSAEARVALHSMRTGQMSDDDWTRLARRMGEVAHAPMFIDDSPNMSMMEIRSKCRRLKQQHDLRLVIIDYLQLMSSPKRVENRQQEVSELSRSLKLLAKELDVPVIAVAQLNRGPEQRQDKRPMLSDLRESGCLTADTRIWRADTGTEVRLGDLVSSGQRDVPVWSLDERLRLVPGRLTHAFPTGVKEVFRVRLRSGREVQATGNHPFLTYDGWRPLMDLAAGSRVAVPRRVPAPLAERELSEAEVITLARELADGAACVPDPVFALPKRQLAVVLRYLWSAAGRAWWDAVGEQARISCASSSRRFLDDVARLLLRFGIVACVRAEPVCRCGTTGRSEPGYQLAICGTVDQLRFLDRIGVRGPGAACAALARQMLLATGCNADPDTIPREVWGRVRAVLAERQLPEREFAAAIGTRLSGAVLQHASPSRARLGRIAAVLDDSELELLATNDVFWDEVACVQSIGRQEVYDATVAGTHNFIANGIHLHNSIEQDADVVILLHREDAYERESPRAGEADFIVAKHRNGPTTTVTVAFQGHYSRFVDMARI